MLEIFIFLKSKLIYIVECKTQHAVITHANIANGIKISTFFEKKLGMVLYLSSASLMLKSIKLVLDVFVEPCRHNSNY